MNANVTTTSGNKINVTDMTHVIVYFKSGATQKHSLEEFTNFNFHQAHITEIGLFGQTAAFVPTSTIEALIFE